MEDDVSIKSIRSKHLTCVLLLDKSGSMNANGKNGKPIDALNKALVKFKEMFVKGEYGTDKEANAKLSAVDLCMIAFGGEEDDGTEESIEILQDFKPANELCYTKPLVANGGTPLAKALETGLEKIEDMKEEYKARDIEYYRPWLICITDGESTETDKNYVDSIKKQLHEAVAENHVLAYAFAVGECRMDELNEFFGKDNVQDYRDKDIEAFAQVFQLLGNSFTAKDNKNEDSNKNTDVDEPLKFIQVLPFVEPGD